MLGRLAFCVVTCGALSACGGSDHPPPIDLNPYMNAAGGAPSDDDGSEPSGGKPSAGTDLRKGGFLNIPSVSDILYDEQHEVLYVSSTQGGLATVTLEDSKIVTQKIGDGPLTGLDLSPGGSLLLICENSVDVDAKEYWIHIADLERGTLREVYFPQFFGIQEGTNDAAFANDETIFLASSFTASGYVPLLRLNLGDDSFEEVGQVVSDTMFARSLDNSAVALAEPKDGTGPFHVIDTATLNLVEGTVSADLHDVAISADGSIMAFPTTGKVKLLKRDDAGKFSVESAIANPSSDAKAAIFSPVSSSLYVVWADHNDSTVAHVERYNVDSGESEGIVQKSIQLAETRLGGFVPTRMRISNDGSLLFITVETGVNVYALEP